MFGYQARIHAVAATTIPPAKRRESRAETTNHATAVSGMRNTSAIASGGIARRNAAAPSPMTAATFASSPGFVAQTSEPGRARSTPTAVHSGPREGHLAGGG